MSEIQGEIEVKRKEIQVETDANKKAELQSELQILLIKFLISKELSKR